MLTDHVVYMNFRVPKEMTPILTRKFWLKKPKNANSTFYSLKYLKPPLIRRHINVFVILDFAAVSMMTINYERKKIKVKPTNVM